MTFLILIFLIFGSCVREGWQIPSDEAPSLERDTVFVAERVDEKTDQKVDDGGDFDDLHGHLDPSYDEELFSVLFEKPEVTVPKIRVALKRNQREFNLFTYGEFRASDGNRRVRIAPGAISLSYQNNQLKISAHNESAMLNIPCTLTTRNTAIPWGVDNSTYRGEIQIDRDESGFIVLNVIDVELYLQGVVPLEIGRRERPDYSALKTQAVAARTYAFRRMSERQRWIYDVLPTVSDQVYGGASVAYPLSDRAIRETAGEVLVYRGELVEAYYHSTCGGKTADIRDVWGGDSISYLKARDDKRANGVSWCAISSVYQWQEQWSVAQFESIVKKYSASTAGVPSMQGGFKNVYVRSRNNSGRVAEVVVETDRGEWIYGGDRVRFIFRRPIDGEPILRSSNFDISYNPRTKLITMSGRGFGHGIGMCQMGAIGRSRDGQSYKEILSHYYSGTEIVDIRTVLSK